MSIQIVEIAQPSVIDTVAVAQPSTVAVVEVRQGPAGADGPAVINAATTSDGTADLLLANVETVTAEVTGTLIAPHIHGNLAGSVYAHVRAGEALEKGDPVYISSSHGSGADLIAIVSKADASNAAKMPAVGIMDAAVVNNANGHMVITGTITELDTDGLTINAELYVAAGGGMTATPPTARAQPVARVERANANNGAILVKVNGLSASDATPSTLVRRTSGGGASLNGLTLSGTGGSPFTSTLTGGVNFANRTFTLPDASGTLATAETLANSATITASTAVAVDTIVLRDGAGKILISNSDVSGTTAYADTAAFTYAAGAASAHRTALGLGTGDSPTFGGADFFTSTTTTLNVYNTLSGANFERLSFRWASNVARIGTAKGGTGSARDLVLETDGTERVRVSAAGAMTATGNFAASGSLSTLGSFTVGTVALGLLARFQATSYGRVLFDSFGHNSSPILQFGASNNTGVALKRSGTTLAVRLANDSADAPLTCSNLTASGTVKTGGYTFATLPTPATGMRAYITDGAAAPVYMANAAGGGSTVTPVFYNGTNWINA